MTSPPPPHIYLKKPKIPTRRRSKTSPSSSTSFLKQTLNHAKTICLTAGIPSHFSVVVWNTPSVSVQMRNAITTTSHSQPAIRHRIRHHPSVQLHFSFYNIQVLKITPPKTRTDRLSKHNKNGGNSKHIF